MFTIQQRTLVGEHYRVLGVDSKATAAEVETAYRDHVRRWHPSRFRLPHSGPVLTAIDENFDLVRVAYRVLGHRSRRRRYDARRLADARSRAEAWHATVPEASLFRYALEKATAETWYHFDVGPIHFRLRQRPIRWLLSVAGPHEIGHALAALAVGGGASIVIDRAELSLRRDRGVRRIAVLLAGPAANLLMVALLCGFSAHLIMASLCGSLGIGGLIRGLLGVACLRPAGQHARTPWYNLFATGTDGWRVWHTDAEYAALRQCRTRW